MTKELLSQRKVNSFSTSSPTPQPDHANSVLSLIDRISINQITTYHWSLEQSLRGLVSCGIPAVGLWNRKILDLEPAQSAELVIDSGIKVSSISLAGGFTGSNEYSFEEAITDAVQLIEFGGQVNAAAVQIASGPRAGHTLNHARELTIDALKRLGDVAALNGTRLALKTMKNPLARNWTFLNSIEATLEVIDACQHPAVGIAIDPGHICLDNTSNNLIADIISLIATVQISEIESGESVQELFPGFDVMEAINDAGYQGYYDLEVWCEQFWQSDYADILTHLRLACQSETPSRFN
ncbi:sugar phosphate isomerase/epimerase family protein [Gimesia algae]|uniref:Xylose isomerase-like TIM barrel n=1 Tax=Gimesia algae TaxID=2527971 RepID=A0A517VCH0_9PLAN|nr:sugar phosphate isomerase/epimerase family protein [Gimesia algae]QDT90688.1 Xylose isomerase-like TIM barrel [Gimesia algae]